MKGLTERPTFETDLLIGDRSLILFSVLPPNNHKNSRLDVADGRITKTRKTDIASKLRHELSSDVTRH